MPSPALHAVRIGTPGSPALIALHGWRQNLDSLRPIAEHLGDLAEIHLLDLPGFGGSEPPPSSWGTADYANAIAGYLDEHRIARADFLGHSYGGKTAMKLASTRPDLVRRLVLIDVSGLPGRPPLGRRLKIRGVKALRSVLKLLEKFGIPLYTRWFIPRFASADYKAAGPLREVFVRVVNEDLTPDIRTIKVPTLLLWGELDRDTPLEMAHRLSELIPGSKLITLPGKDHFPFVGAGAASLCAFHIREFLAKTQDV